MSNPSVISKTTTSHKTKIHSPKWLNDPTESKYVCESWDDNIKMYEESVDPTKKD